MNPILTVVLGPLTRLLGNSLLDMLAKKAPARIRIEEVQSRTSTSLHFRFETTTTAGVTASRPQIELLPCRSAADVAHDLLDSPYADPSG